MVTGEDTEQGQLRRTLDNLRQRVGLTSSSARRRVGLDLVGREVVGGVGALAGLVTIWGDDARLAGRQIGERYRRHLKKRPAVEADEAEAAPPGGERADDELERLRQAHEARLQELEERYHRELTALESQLATLKSDLDLATRRAARARRAADAAQHQLEQRQKSQGDRTARIEQLEAELEREQRGREAAEQLTVELREQLRGHEAESDRLRAELEDLRGQLDRVAQEVEHDTEAVILRLEERLSRLTAERDEARKSVAELEERRQALQRKLDDQAEGLERRISALVEEHERALAERDERVAKLTRRAKRALAELKTTKEQLATTEASIQTCRALEAQFSWEILEMTEDAQEPEPAATEQAGESEPGA